MDIQNICTCTKFAEYTCTCTTINITRLRPLAPPTVMAVLAVAASVVAALLTAVLFVFVVFSVYLVTAHRRYAHIPQPKGASWVNNSCWWWMVLIQVFQFCMFFSASFLATCQCWGEREKRSFPLTCGMNGLLCDSVTLIVCCELCYSCMHVFFCAVRVCECTWSELVLGSEHLCTHYTLMIVTFRLAAFRCTCTCTCFSFDMQYLSRKKMTINKYQSCTKSICKHGCEALRPIRSAYSVLRTMQELFLANVLWNYRNWYYLVHSWSQAIFCIKFILVLYALSGFNWQWLWSCDVSCPILHLQT